MGSVTVIAAPCPAHQPTEKDQLYVKVLVSQTFTLSRISSSPSSNTALKSNMQYPDWSLKLTETCEPEGRISAPRISSYQDDDPVLDP
jgi:hypothetical protein